LTLTVGANNLVRIAAQDIIVDDSDIVWLVSQGQSGSWREHLLRSTAPQAAGQTFQNLGPISTTASAQSTRIVVDAGGLIHTSYYRNTGAGEYYHRIFDPVAGAWQGTETLLGNTTAGNDYYGQLTADALGNVHALYVQDSTATATWGYRYRRYDPTNLWSAPVVVDDVATATYTGVANYRDYGIACEESSGIVYLVYRDLNMGGALNLLTKDLAATSFMPVAQLTPATTTLHAYYLPAVRGTLYPAFNRTGFDLGVTWNRPGTATAWEYVYLGSSTPVAGPTLMLTAPAVIGTVTTLDLDSPTDPSGTYACGFALSDTPGILLPGGGTLGLAFDALLQLSLMPGNGVFFNNIGVLDPTGRASVAIAVPNIPTIVGATVYAAFAVLDPQNPSLVGTISPTLPITIQ
jgi:hypothetical protein